LELGSNVKTHGVEILCL